MADPNVQVAVKGERELQVSLPISEAKNLCIFHAHPKDICFVDTPMKCNLTNEGCFWGQPVIHPDNVPQK